MELSVSHIILFMLVYKNKLIGGNVKCQVIPSENYSQ